MRLTCHDCGSQIYISPGAPNCPECGADLESYLRALEYVRECYRQASEETLAGDHERALAILAQGLSAVNASELHLLAALIYRKQGEYDGMRRHVAAIPVDDPLRPEGEWLLRSHQQSQRAVRQAQREYSNTPAQVGKAARQLSPDFYRASTTYDAPLPPQRTSSPRVWPVIVALLALVVLFLLLRQPLASGLALLTSARPTATDFPTPVQPAPAVVDAQATPVPAQDSPTPLPVAENIPPTDAPGAAVSQPAASPAEAATPTPPAADNTLSANPQVNTEANQAILAALATAQANRGNLTAYLEQAGRSDLAALPINAVFQDGKLTISGILSLTYQRLELLDLAGRMPGVVEMDSTDLVVNLPKTYIVGDGDTLWTIAYYIYGDGARWEDLYAANQALLGPYLLIDVGMELQVPEIPAPENPPPAQ